MIRGAADLLLDLGYDPEVASTGAVQRLAEPDRRVLGTLSGPTLPEHPARVLGLPVPEVVAALMRMELVGLVRNVGGRYEATIAVPAALAAAVPADGSSPRTVAPA
jgi:predicted Rossmann fold nucleotide-binding protein DprA/Smf involved in DNA uptake